MADDCHKDGLRKSHRPHPRQTTFSTNRANLSVFFFFHYTYVSVAGILTWLCVCKMLTMFTLNWRPGFQHKLVMVNSNKRVNRTISLFLTLFEIVLPLNTCSPSHNRYIIPNRQQAVMFCHAIHWNDHMRLGSFSRLRDNLLTSKGLLAVDRTPTFCGVFTPAAFSPVP